MAEVLAAFAFATDLGMAQPMGHVIRACYIGQHLANALGLSPDERADLYYATLLMHSGCTASSTTIATFFHEDEMVAAYDVGLSDPQNALDMLQRLARHLTPGVPLPARVQQFLNIMIHMPPAILEGQRATCEVAARIAQRLGLSTGVRQILLNLYERWDGKGPNGLRGQAVPLGARIVDATSMIEMFHYSKGPAAAEDFASVHRGRAYDPQVVDCFLNLARKPAFWDELAREDLWQDILAMEPATAHPIIGEEKLDDVIMAFGDFADLKSDHTAGHAKGTAQAAEPIARRLGLPAREVTTIRRAAFVHDLGHAAVPTAILDKTQPLSEAEKERLRLHPYYTERILARVAPLRPLADIAGAHHEYLNGLGYYRGLSGNQVPLGARVLAVADEFDDLTQGRSQPTPLEPADALARMQPRANSQFSAECLEALAQELDLAVPKRTRRHDWPGGLSDREVEVLRLMARGQRNRQMAQSLVVSEKTVGHHIEHIYNKLGISSRGAAVFFAIEHDLVA
jgi:HD-GYP domain-containing protein (c-di-GMP phosphodiesterase class II)